MNKKTKLALLIGAVAAVVSAVVKKQAVEEDWDDAVEETPAVETEEAPAYDEQELADFADLSDEAAAE